MTGPRTDRPVAAGEFLAAARRVCTDRQVDALRLAAEGLGYRRIGVVLGVSPSTAKEHLQRAVAKTVAEIERSADGS